MIQFLPWTIRTRGKFRRALGLAETAKEQYLAAIDKPDQFDREEADYLMSYTVALALYDPAASGRVLPDDINDLPAEEVDELVAALNGYITAHTVTTQKN